MPPIEPNRPVLAGVLIGSLLLGGLYGAKYWEERARIQPAGNKTPPAVARPSDVSGLYQKTLSRRRFFFSNFTKSNELLLQYENGGASAVFTHPGKGTLRIEPKEIFYSDERLLRDIGIEGNETPREQVKKIFDFVKSHRKLATPLYENHALHHSSHFFSAYGMGYCDDTAANLSYLAKRYGFDARTWWLHGHVVSEVFYDDAWRVYDADTLGIVYKDGEVAGRDRWVELAEEDSFEKFNEVIRSVQNNRTITHQIYLPQDPGEPYLEFLPGERKLFFDEAYLLTTDGLELKKLSPRSRFFEEYKDIANFIREIPIKENMNAKGELTVRDYFPVAGGFILVPGLREKPTLKILPEVFVDSAVLSKDHWFAAPGYSGRNLKNAYFSLAPGIKTLERSPSYELSLRNLKELAQKYPKAKLLTVHFYSRTNTRLDDTALDEIKKSGVQTTSHPR